MVSSNRKHWKEWWELGKLLQGSPDTDVRRESHSRVESRCSKAFSTPALQETGGTITSPLKRREEERKDIAEVVSVCRQSQVCAVRHANCRTILPLNNSAPGQGCAARSISVLIAQRRTRCFPIQSPVQCSLGHGGMFFPDPPAEGVVPCNKFFALQAELSPFLAPTKHSCPREQTLRPQSRQFTSHLHRSGVWRLCPAWLWGHRGTALPQQSPCRTA